MMSMYKLGILEDAKQKTKENNSEQTDNSQEPQLVRTPDNKFRFEDGTKKYSSQESAKNALQGFRKFQAKRNEASYLIHKKPYEEYVEELTPDEKTEYDKNIKQALKK